MKRKFLEGFLLLSAAAAVCVGGAAIEASAATLVDGKAGISIDYENQKLTISEPTASTNKTKDLQVFFGVSSAKADKKTGKTVVKTSAWETYDLVKDGNALKATIDLSSLKNTVDNYIQIKGNVDSDPITIQIPSVDKKVKGVFNAAEGTVVVNDMANAKEPAAIAAENLEYRTQFGSWTEYAADINFKIYQQRGGTLYFRTKSAEAGDLPTDVVEGTEYTNEAGEAISVIQAGKFPGVEAKVATGKLANAPKVTADYVKNTITIPKKAEYRVIANNATDLPAAWTDAGDAGVKLEQPKDADSTGLDLSKACVYEVRTKATEAAGKAAAKPASKTSQLAISAKRTFTVNEGSDGENIGGAFIGDDEAAPIVKVEIGDLKKGKYAVTITSVDTEDVYEVIAVTASADDEKAPAFTDKATGKVAAAKVKGESITATVSKMQIAENTVLYIRKAGNKKTLNWTTDWVKVGNVAVTPAEPTE